MDDTVADDDSDELPPVRRSSMPAVGMQFGRYTIEKLLGRGGMGAVYEANDPSLARKVALKVLRADKDHDTEGLRREAQALAKLVHQNVVMVYDVGIAGDQVFLVMQLVDGVTLDAWIADKKPSIAAILDLFEQAGQGLIGAHAAGLVHCDFKPGNVLVDRTGMARVTDFGLAQGAKAGGTPSQPAEALAASITSIASLSPILSMTTVAGTPAYMAPEQFAGNVTAASDQFAFCCALWECLSGERPYADSVMPILDATARGARKPMPPNARVPRYVMRALERGMAPDPSERFASMAELLVALEPPRPWIHIALAAGGIGLLVGGIVAYVAFAKDEVAPWDAADFARRTPMTSFGTDACAYAPTVEPGGKLVVFDRTKGDLVDLYAVPIAGGVARAATSAPDTWEWRAQPGRRPGEVVHLIHDTETDTNSLVAYLDLATGVETPIVKGLIWDAALVGDSLYYSPEAMAGVRVQRGTHDSQFIQPPRDRVYFLIAGSPMRDRIALTSQDRNGGPTQPCLVELATGGVECLPIEITTRPVFSPDGTALYLGTYGGIVRRDLATKVMTPVATVEADGGIAVSPDGSALVYSTCSSHEKLVELSTGKPILDDLAVEAAISSTGSLAWVQSVRGSWVLVARTPDGRDTQLTTAALGNVSLPKFSPDGKRIVFASSEPNPGLRIADVDRPGQLLQITNDARHKRPMWTTNGLVAFTEGDADANDHAFVVPADGNKPPRALGDGTRVAYGVRGREVLLSAADAMHWYDTETNVEHAGPPRPPGLVNSASTSPSGSWVVYQMGPTGQDIWRVRVDPPGDLEHVRTYDAGDLVRSPTIRDDGSIIASVGRWYGDLVKIPAKPGTKF